jgi:hypothetical protein
MELQVNYQIKHLMNDNIKLNVQKKFMINRKVKYHVVVLDTTTFLEKTGNRKSHIFRWPMRISGPKCFKPENSKRLTAKLVKI